MRSTDDTAATRPGHEPDQATDARRAPVKQAIELLAPARDLVCGKAAIDAGADAVYIGAPQFGARSRAGNSLDDIAALVAYAHTFWARVYVTVNTLLHDRELEAAVDLIRRLHGIEVDAVIIQDLGLLECDLPPIALIASTQMHNHTPERVAFLEQAGFRRAILARELSLDEIWAIRRATDQIELEAFVQGALCVCYSGQCYLSYAVGGRSGNRGECAQPCRRLYDLIDSRDRTLVKGRHLLSLRDLCRIGDLGPMLDAGVSSFKIEGRLKDTAYVTNVVCAYRQALDAEISKRALPRSSSGTSSAGFSPDLGKTFNRGFTDYYLHGRSAHGGTPTSPGAVATPKMVGELLGSVSSMTRRDFVIDRRVALRNGDGLTFFDTDGLLQGTSVNGTKRTARGLVVTPNSMDHIRVGTRIHRNHDRAFLDSVGRGAPARTIGVLMALSENADGFMLQLVDEDGCAVDVCLPTAKVTARNPARAQETALAQLAKTGGSVYRCDGVSLEWSKPFFLPYSELNSLRRRGLEALADRRRALRPREAPTHHNHSAVHPASALDYRGNVLNKRAAAFYRWHGVKHIDPAAETGLDMRGRVVMTTRYCIKEELGWCPRDVERQSGEAPPHDEQLFLVDDHDHRNALRFHCHAAPEGCGMDVIY